MRKLFTLISKFNHRSVTCLVIFFSMLLISSCSKEIINTKDYTNYEPQNINDGLSVSNISSYAIDTNLIRKMTYDLISEQLYNVHSVLIYKDSALLYEKYLCGKDQDHGKQLGIVRHDIYSVHDARSISKSVVSACIGIAIQKRLIQSVNDPIGKYFPEICNTDKKYSITIRDLLTMSSGLCWKEIGSYDDLLNDETKMDLSLNPIKFIINKSLEHEPGMTWNYSAGNTQLLAEIIKRTSGQNIDQFASENLFSPLRITEHEWACLSINKEPAAASGLRLSSRSLLKFGLLYKDQGKFNGTQYIDSSWIASSISSQLARPSLSDFNLREGGYGFQFWTYDYSFKNNNLKIIEAKGNGGQTIFICKELNLLIVITAGNYGQLAYNDLPFKILYNYILPSIQ